MTTATAVKNKTKGKGKGALKFRPLDDRIVIRASEAEERTTGGIFLPDAAKEKPQRGEVVAVGPGKLLDSGARGELSVGVGDSVFYGKYAGTEIEIDGEELVAVHENDILAIIDR